MREATTMTRRTFAKAAGLAGLAAAGAGASSGLFGEAPKQAFADEEASGDQIVYTHCHVNCGGACVLQCHVKDGELAYVESDTAGSSEFGDVQARACLRGRSIRRWLGSD